MARAESAAVRVYGATRSRILRGELPGGTVITEGEISSWYGVSRTPVREAFLRLERDGLLRLHPKRGALVSRLADTDVRALLDVRELIEEYAATTLLTRIDDPPAGLLAALWSGLDDQHRAIVARDVEAFTDADIGFHSRIVAAADNPVLAEVYESLRDRQARVTLAALTVPGRMQTCYHEHVRLVEVLESGDLDAYLHHMRAHMRATTQACIAVTGAALSEDAGLPVVSATPSGRVADRRGTGPARRTGRDTVRGPGRRTPG